MGQYGLRKLQVGKEGTKGTAVTAGVILTGLDGQMADTSTEQEKPLQYQTGLLPGSNQGSPVFVTDLFEVAFNGEATFENLPYVLSAGWQGATPVTAGSGTTWTFPPPTTAANSNKTLTVQTGDNTEQLKGAYGIIPEFELKGSVNDTLKLSGKIMGRSVTAGTGGFDAATPLAATTMPVNNFKIYYDPASGTIGTTQLSATIREFDVKAKSGFHLKQFADGVLYPTSDGQAQPDVEIDMVLEYNSNAVSIRSDWKNKNQKRMRIQSGSSITALNTFNIDVAGYITNVAAIAEKDGNTTAAVKFHCMPAGTTTADYVSFNLVDSVSAL